MSNARLLSTIPAAALLLSAGILAAQLSPNSPRSITPDAAEPREITPRGPLLPEEQAIVDLVEGVAPSVVYINTTAERIFYDRMTRREVRREEVPTGTGSGFVWDDQGHIVTNFHVVESLLTRRSNNAIVTFAEGPAFNARLVGFSPEDDLAVLRLETDNNATTPELKPIPIGTSSDLRVGQSVYALGNPFGLDQTLTTGIISALGRTIPARAGIQINDVIQTDAAINPGNSGGPLLDSAGRLIGVNTAIRSPSGASAGIGFAIPVDTVNEIVPQLITYGRRIPGILGIKGTDGFVNDNGTRRPVVLVLEVNNPSAQAAGLRAIRTDADNRIVSGDAVLALNDRPIRSLNELQRTLRQFKPEDTVTLSILRIEPVGEPRQLTLRVTLTQPPDIRPRSR